MKTFASLFIFTGLLAAPIANAGEYTYSAYGYTSQNGETCQSAAQELRSRFEAITGITPYGFGCDYQDSTKETHILIKYRADAPLNVVSNQPWNAIYEPAGIYSSKEACLEQRLAQVGLFEQQTGLRAFASYCAFKRLTQGMNWHIYIDAFGETSRLPWRSSINTTTPFFPNSADVEHDIVTKLRTKNVTLAAMVWRPYRPTNKLTLIGFANEDIRIQSRSLASIQGLDHCSSIQRDLAQSLAGNPDYVTSYCESSKSEPRNFELSAVGFKELSTTRISAETYPSLEECQGQLPRIQSEQRGLHGPELTSFCGFSLYSQEAWRGIFIYEKN
jgi:hypothetical protein